MCVWMLGLAEGGVRRMPSVCNAGRLTHTSGDYRQAPSAPSISFSLTTNLGQRCHRRRKLGATHVESDHLTAVHGVKGEGYACVSGF